MRLVTESGLSNPELGDWFGASLASGDLNGDGIDDLAVGTPSESINWDPESGQVMVLKGVTGGSMLQPWSNMGQDSWGGVNQKGDWFGGSLSVVKAGIALHGRLAYSRCSWKISASQFDTRSCIRCQSAE